MDIIHLERLEGGVRTCQPASCIGQIALPHHDARFAGRGGGGKVEAMKLFDPPHVRSSSVSRLLL